VADTTAFAAFEPDAAASEPSGTFADRFLECLGAFFATGDRISAADHRGYEI
jgi:hypothetical protein